MEEKIKIWLKIAAVVLLLGPLIFIGVCFPLAFVGQVADSLPDPIRYSLFYGAWILGGAVAIFACYKIIKKILIK